MVDNRGGASGAIGAAIVAKAPAHGYTLYFVIASHTILPATMGKQLQYVTVKDLPPSADFLDAQPVRGPAGLQINTLQDLIDAAKQAPGKIFYGSVGYGKTVHITAALFEQATGTRLMHVPYKSSVTSTEAVISGEVALGASSVFTGGQAVREGRLKALAVVGDHRF